MRKAKQTTAGKDTHLTSKDAKFGAFKGVFTPSILTILGVIMYLRFGWVVGHAGLIGTAAVVLLAHLISYTTGLREPLSDEMDRFAEHVTGFIAHLGTVLLVRASSKFEDASLFYDEE
jgi:hypothetical protein